MSKIHFHSDCMFFAGCENMLTNFFNSNDFRSKYSVSFSYRESELYTKGLYSRLSRDLPIYPISFIEISDFIKYPENFNLFIKRAINGVVRLLLTGPLFIYEIMVLFFIFKNLQPDILHINNGGYPAALSARAAAIAGKLAGIKKIYMVVNNMGTDYKHFLRWLDLPFDMLVKQSVGLFITGSVAAANRLRSVLNLPSNKVVSIHNGIAVRQTTEDIDTTINRLGLTGFKGSIFGMVAIHTPRKGHIVLLEAILELIKTKKIIHNAPVFLIEGDGPLRNELIDFVNTYKLNPWVKFVGEEKNIVDFMSILDVLVLPSIHSEDFPNVILESMSLGIPVIASKIAGTPEQVIDNVTGLLVEPANVAQLSDAIVKLVSSSILRDKMGKAALQYFHNNFTSEVALNNYDKLYSN